MAFNPEKYLIDLQGQSYLEVKWRLVWFRSCCPGGTIDTEEVTVDLDRAVEDLVPTGRWIENPNRPGRKMLEKVVKYGKGYARFHAVVTDGLGGRASATKSENGASFPDYVEKAETGSVGRALAMLGYGTQFTGDELDEDHRIVDAPVTPAVQKAPVAGVTSKPPVTPATPVKPEIKPEIKPESKQEAVAVASGDTLATVKQIQSIRMLCQRLSKPDPARMGEMTLLAAKELIVELSREYNEVRQF